MLAALESTLADVSSYAERFREGLGRPGKSRKGAAAAIGISVQAVGAIANGKSKSATAENNVSAAAYFGCDANWLATGRGDPGWRADLVLNESGRAKYVVESKAPRPPDAPPPPPDAKFTDSNHVSDSDWATLEAVKLFIPEHELKEQIGRASCRERV